MTYKEDQNAPTPRVRCEDESRSVWIDDELIAIEVEPVPYLFFAAVAEGKGRPVRSYDVRTLKGMLGKNIPRDAFCKLPPELKKVIKSKRGGGGGYYLSLPQKSELYASAG